MRRRIVVESFVESTDHYSYGYSHGNLGNVAEHCDHFARGELTAQY
jgi:hypothetical protein